MPIIDFHEFVHLLLFAPKGLNNGHTAQVLLNKRIEIADFSSNLLKSSFYTALKPSCSNKKYGNNTKANQNQHRIEEEEHSTKHNCYSKQVAKNDKYSLRENL